MGGLFSYDSKPMQILMFVGDLIILNILYLICCIPIFTIGAAQAGMYTACKVLLDKEDDSSPYIFANKLRFVFAKVVINRTGYASICGKG